MSSKFSDMKSDKEHWRDGKSATVLGFILLLVLVAIGFRASYFLKMLPPLYQKLEVEHLPASCHLIQTFNNAHGVQALGVVAFLFGVIPLFALENRGRANRYLSFSAALLAGVTGLILLVASWPLLQMVDKMGR